MEARYAVKYLVFFGLILACHVTFAYPTYSSEVKTLKSDFTSDTFDVSILTEPELDELFKVFANNSLIPFDLLSDGCYARAYLMITSAKLRKIQLAKLVVEVKNPAQARILVTRPNIPWILRWNYHVAPIVFVRNSQTNLPEEKIIDPSLFNRPVSRSEFVAYLSIDPLVELDVFILSGYLSEKKQMMSDVNMETLDMMMLRNLNTAKDFAELHGSYFEKTAFLDQFNHKCYKGGLEVELSACIP